MGIKGYLLSNVITSVIIAILVFLVDKSYNDLKKARIDFKLLKQNLSNFNFEYKIYLNDALRALKYFNEKQFDVIFLDPPYETGCIEKVLPIIAERNILKTDGYIIVECTKNEDFTQIIANGDYRSVIVYIDDLDRC